MLNINAVKLKTSFGNAYVICTEMQSSWHDISAGPVWCICWTTLLRLQMEESHASTLTCVNKKTAPCIFNSFVSRIKLDENLLWINPVFYMHDFQERGRRIQLSDYPVIVQIHPEGLLIGIAAFRSPQSLLIWKCPIHEWKDWYEITVVSRLMVEWFKNNNNNNTRHNQGITSSANIILEVICDSFVFILM